LSAKCVEIESRYCNVIEIVSERDLVRYISNDEFKNGIPVTKIMSKNLITCNLNTSVTELMEIITNNKIKHILVMEKKLLGIASIGDVVNYIIDQYKEKNQYLRDFIK
jgi:CBS domain-containing protein